jgi:hypothetical protein
MPRYLFGGDAHGDVREDAGNIENAAFVVADNMDPMLGKLLDVVGDYNNCEDILGLLDDGLDGNTPRWFRDGSVDVAAMLVNPVGDSHYLDSLVVDNYYRNLRNILLLLGSFQAPVVNLQLVL